MFWVSVSMDFDRSTTLGLLIFALDHKREVWLWILREELGLIGSQGTSHQIVTKGHDVRWDSALHK